MKCKHFKWKVIVLSLNQKAPPQLLEGGFFLGMIVGYCYLLITIRFTTFSCPLLRVTK